MLDTQMSGVPQKEAETDATSEESSEEAGISEKRRRRRRAISDAERRLGFGPYAAFTYEEVWQSKPEYFKFLSEEGKRDNRTGRFTHWAMASVADAFFKRGE